MNGPYNDRNDDITNSIVAYPMSKTPLDSEGKPKLMGNLSIQKLNIDKATFQKMAEELDIDNIIQKED
jgi:hypothetical protein